MNFETFLMLKVLVQLSRKNVWLSFLSLYDTAFRSRATWRMTRSGGVLGLWGTESVDKHCGISLRGR
jgi:hypothetical protein